jgi:peptide/nickel transport system substrate-binding protein
MLDEPRIEAKAVAMGLNATRRAVASALLAALLLTGGCDRSKHEGEVVVLVIGDKIGLADPASGPLTAPQAVLLSNVAQGLVRFDANGEIVPGLAERWNVSNDGLSYIFRIASEDWPGGGHITAKQVAALLKRQLAGASDNGIKDSLGAVEDVVAMTDRVIEIRLSAPRPNLLQLLAQPELALVREGRGTGPFHIAKRTGPDRGLELERETPVPDSEEESRETLTIAAAEARPAIATFLAGNADLVLGGTFDTLPLATGAEVAKAALRFDPVTGLFGLIPARKGGPLDDPELRELLDRAIDRQAFITVLGVPGLVPRATVLEAGLDGIVDAVQPAWLSVPIGERRAQLMAQADRLFGEEERPTLRIALPDGPGAKLLFDRLAADWGVLGIKLERAGAGRPADLKLIDEVAPSNSPAWFVRHFRCDEAALCDEDIDELLATARTTVVPDQRWALLADAARRIDEAQLFLPLTAPVRWSLVSPRITGFAGNRFARHTLVGLREQLASEGTQ